MTRKSIAAVVFALAASRASAQDALPQAPPPAPVPAQQPGPPPPATMPDAAASASALSRDKIQRIYLIRQYEALLTNAVKTGANSLAGMLNLADPTSLFVTGNARARGFELDGYGIIFDVDVPTMMQSVLWSAQTMQRQQELDKWREMSQNPDTPDGMRRVAQGEVRRLQRLLANQPGASGVPAGLAVAQTTDTPATMIHDGSRVLPASPDPRSPDEMYTDVIKNALIDAMLSFGPVLRLGDGEWLTVAARATTPAVSNQLDDASSILIRIKGADLAAFMSGKLSRDAVLNKLEIKEG